MSRVVWSVCRGQLPSVRMRARSGMARVAVENDTWWEVDRGLDLICFYIPVKMEPARFARKHVMRTNNRLNFQQKRPIYIPVVNANFPTRPMRRHSCPVYRESREYT